MTNLNKVSKQLEKVVANTTPKEAPGAASIITNEGERWYVYHSAVSGADAFTITVPPGRTYSTPYIHMRVSTAAINTQVGMRCARPGFYYTSAHYTNPIIHSTVILPLNGTEYWVSMGPEVDNRNALTAEAEYAIKLPLIQFRPGDLWNIGAIPSGGASAFSIAVRWMDKIWEGA